MVMMAVPALAGDLWLTVDKDAAEQVTLRMPADWLLEDGEPVRLQTDSGPVELRQQARALKRAPVAWTVQDDEGPLQVTLARQPASGDPASQLTLSALVGPMGVGLNLTFPLDAYRLGDARDKLGAAVDIDGLQLDLDDAACAQLRRSPPTVLLEVVDDGHTFRIATE